MMNKKSVKSLPVQNKKVLVRVDFNVPIKNGQVSDDTRIRESLPTIRYLLEQNALVILCSHLGRPKGTVQPKYSLQPAAQALEKLLKTKVFFVSDCVGGEVKERVAGLRPQEVLLLENLRFHPEEEKNQETFAHQLSSGYDVFVQDAFGAVHRAHASTSAITKFLSAAAGFLLEKEIASLEKILKNPQPPFLAILGGAKVSDKIGVIQNLLNRADAMAVGGAMAYTFLKSQGFKVGNSLVEDDKLKLAKEILSNGNKLSLPSDHLIALKAETGTHNQTTKDQNISEGWMGVDIGPQTIKQIQSLIQNAKTIFWNGPLGIFEIQEFAQGTLACARAVAEATKKGAYSVVGGGDSIAALNQTGLSDSISHVSTGGGASLEFLEGRTLPGIEALPNA